MIFEDEAIWNEDIFKTTCESLAEDGVCLTIFEDNTNTVQP